MQPMSTTHVASGPFGAAARIAGDRSGLVWFLLAVVAPIPLFWYGFDALVRAWGTAEYSHGPLIPLLSGFMFMREMTQVPPVDRPVRDRWPGYAIVLFALALAAIGNLVQIADIVFYAIVIWVAGLVVTCFGLRRGWYFWPAVLHLVFMLPLPQFLYYQINIQLQFISSEIGVALVRAFGIPVFLDGNVIDLGVYKLLVAEACSGLRYLFPIMSFSYIFCVLYRGPSWHKATLLLAAVPMAVLMNSFRIGMIGILVDNYGIAHAEGFLHYFEGWVIFGACIGLLFLLARLLQLSVGDRRPLSVALDLEFEGLGPQFRRALDITPSAALIAGALTAAAASAAYVAAPDLKPATVERSDFEAFPLAFEEWRGVRGAPLEPEVERVLAADDWFSGFYRTPGGGGVDLWTAYYRKQTEGQGVHSPEVCLPGGGWEMYDLSEPTIALPEETGIEPFAVNRAVIQKGDNLQLVYYWVDGRGRRLTGDIEAKVWMVWDSIRRGRTDGALVRLITPLADGEDPSDGDARLQAFMADLLPRLGPYIPE